MLRRVRRGRARDRQVGRVLVPYGSVAQGGEFERKRRPPHDHIVVCLIRLIFVEVYLTTSFVLPLLDPSR